MSGAGCEASTLMVKVMWIFAISRVFSGCSQDNRDDFTTKSTKITKKLGDKE